MFVLSPEEMKNLDNHTINEVGIDGMILMENAGKKSAEIIELNIIEPYETIAVICGTGNNGGDGFVIARWLHNHNFDVNCFIVGQKDKFSPSAQKNYDILSKLSCNITFIKNETDLEEEFPLLENNSVFIDALFGIGLKGEIKGFRKKLIEIVNNISTKTIAVDIASGINANTGRIANIAIAADYTITMDALKYGHLLYPGRKFSGEVYIVDIGILPETYNKFLPRAEILDNIDVYFPERPSDSNKTDFGRVSIIAGSYGLTGAAIMSSKATLEMGSGLIKLIHPKSLANIFENSLIEVMSKGVDETSEKTISSMALDSILNFIKHSDAIAIGPGISRNDDTAKFVRNFLAQNNKPTVIDADAINAYKNNINELNNILGKPYIFTPHIKEFARLSGISVEEIKANRIQKAVQFAKKYQIVLLLKGSTSVITDGEKIIFNTNGNTGLSTGGSGDVLTGIIVSLLGQGYDCLEAASLGAFILGKTADIVANDFGHLSTTPSKIIKNIYRSLSFEE